MKRSTDLNATGQDTIIKELRKVNKEDDHYDDSTKPAPIKERKAPKNERKTVNSEESAKKSQDSPTTAKKTPE